MRSILEESYLKQRTKRGLLDVGGTILNALFGVATTAQLTRFQAALTEVSQDQQDIRHAYHQLTTIVNQTRSFVQQLEIRHQQLHAHVTHLHRAITQVNKIVNDHERRLRRLELVSDLDRYMDTLDMATQNYAHQLTVFHQQRAELEQGQLTRDLLSEDQLKEILRQASTTHQVIGNLEWYYQFLTVAPIWQDTAHLLYKVEIPLVAPRPYIVYKVLSHPVPVSNSTLTIHMQVEDVYAIDTTSGNLFTPKFCVGHTPIVCQTGPEYGDTQKLCARGLLTDRPSLIKKCKINIRDYSGEPIIKTIDLNQYAISSLGEAIVVRCPGRPEAHYKLPRGALNVTCVAPCTITGQGWTITCIDRLYLARRYVMPAVRVMAHFNFSVLITPEKLHTALPDMVLADTSVPYETDISNLMYPTMPRTTIITTSSLSLFTIINMACIFLLVVLATIIVLRRKYCKSKPQEVYDVTEILPLSDSTPDSRTSQAPPIATAPSIWPVLPPLSQCLSQSCRPNVVTAVNEQ